MGLAQRASSHVLLGKGQWFDGSVLTNPTSGTVLADTGQLAAGNYLVSVHGAASAQWVYDAEHRNAGNTANVNSQRRRPRTGNEDFPFPNKIELALNERVRCTLVDNLTGELQMSVFVQEVE